MCHLRCSLFVFFSLQIYCCLGALAIADTLHHVNADMLGWWLCERQLPSGGLNGELERVSRNPYWPFHVILAISELLSASVSKQGFAQNYTFENVFHQDIHFHANQNYFYMKRFACGLILEQRQKGVKKWLI